MIFNIVLARDDDQNDLGTLVAEASKNSEKSQNDSDVPITNDSNAVPKSVAFESTITWPDMVYFTSVNAPTLTPKYVSSITSKVLKDTKPVNVNEYSPQISIVYNAKDSQYLKGFEEAYMKNKLTVGENKVIQVNPFSISYKNSEKLYNDKKEYQIHSNGENEDQLDFMNYSGKKKKKGDLKNQTYSTESPARPNDKLEYIDLIPVLKHFEEFLKLTKLSGDTYGLLPKTEKKSESKYDTLDTSKTPEQRYNEQNTPSTLHNSDNTSNQSTTEMSNYTTAKYTSTVPEKVGSGDAKLYLPKSTVVFNELAIRPDLKFDTSNIRKMEENNQFKDKAYTIDTVVQNRYAA